MGNKAECRQWEREKDRTSSAGPGGSNGY